MFLVTARPSSHSVTIVWQLDQHVSSGDIQFAVIVLLDGAITGAHGGPFV